MTSYIQVFGYLSLVWLCLDLPFEAVAYPNGAPISTCVSMLPDHGRFSNNPCPFESLPEKVEMFSNETLTLYIKSKVNVTNTYRGFLILGFDNATDTVVGTFRTTSNLTQPLRCYDTYDTAVTHTSSSRKTNLTVEWIPPEGYDGTVIFKNTFVESENVYWLKEPSLQVKVISAGLETTTLVTTNNPLETTVKPVVPDVYSGCASLGIKGCIGTPSGCLESRSCSSVTTYRKVDDEHLEIEIYGQVSADEYVAVGFSKDREMSFDSVVECVNYRNTLNAYQSYNIEGKNNQRLKPQLTEFSLSHSSYVDGYIYCRVFHPINYVVDGVTFDLSKPHHLLMAAGPTGERNIGRHTSEESSSSTIVLTDDLGISYFEAPSRTLKRLHGSFMIIAWLISASVGIMMPNYMKKTWVGRKLMGKDVWFVCHQILMLITWTLTMIGFIIIFIDVGGWVSEPFSVNRHPVIGCITTVLAFVQPFMAALRPPPGSPTRYIFNWAHSVIGNVAHILAIVCIFLAVEMEEAELPYETYWILTAHVGFYLISHLFLNFLEKKYSHQSKGKLKDISVPKDAPGASVRKAYLVAFIVVMVGLGVTVVAFVCGATD